MHHIQYTIIDLLIHNDILRFSELKPKGLESNLFQYHLKYTIKEGYVCKVEGGYTLTPKGLYYADRHSVVIKGERKQPKIITIIVVSDQKGRVILLPKDKQPFFGTYHLPAGKIHEGESIDEAASRELKEKVSIGEVGLRYAMTVYAHIKKEGQLVSGYIGFVYTGTTEETKNLTCYDANVSASYDLAPSVAEILSNVTSPPSSPLSIDIEI